MPDEDYDIPETEPPPQRTVDAVLGVGHRKQKIAHTEATRRAVLRDLADGVGRVTIRRRYKVDLSTMSRWSKASGILAKSHVSEEEFDALFDAWGDTYREMEAKNPGNERSESMKKLSDLRKFGVTSQQKQDNLDLFREMGGDPDEAMSACSEYFAQLIGEMNREVSVDGQAKAMIGAMILSQIRGAFRDMPKISSWSDLEKAVNLFWKVRGLDEVKGTAGRLIDLNILNSGKTPPRRIK